jgi:hypothetical protein
MFPFVGLSMRADPEFCNEEARRCIQLAAGSSDPEVKRTFTDLAESWRRMAAQLYYANTILELRKDKRNS